MQNNAKSVGLFEVIWPASHIFPMLQESEIWRRLATDGGNLVWRTLWLCCVSVVGHRRAKALRPHVSTAYGTPNGDCDRYSYNMKYSTAEGLDFDCTIAWIVKARLNFTCIPLRRYGPQKLTVPDISILTRRKTGPSPCHFA